MNKEKIADAATATAWGLFGMSLTQINELLQTLALILTIVATTITIVRATCVAVKPLRNPISSRGLRLNTIATIRVGIR